jgi:pilus assembly protein CpaF
VSISSGIRERILRGQPPDEDGLDELVALDAVRLGRDGVHEVRSDLAADLLGAGPLEPHLADPCVTDILVNGDGSVWVDRGAGLQRVEEAAGLGPESTRRLAVRLAGLAGRRLDESQPWVDGLLPGGVRLHAVLPPLVDVGAHLSLRVPRQAGSRLADLEARGMFGAETATLLRQLVARRVSLLVTGGTGTGKTTLLGGLLAEVPGNERIVLVEDVRELSVAHPHTVRLQGRMPNVEGRGEVTLVDLVRQALRMRPDRLVVGEVRGAEVRELLAALNTGHEGGCGTVHANSPGDVVARFEALGALAGLGRDAVHAQLASAVQAVVHVRRDARGRAVESLSVLRRTGPVLDVARAVTCTTGERGPGWPLLARVLEDAP